MEWLNYHHLYYFSVIVREGGVAAAARSLRLTHSTLSAQLRALEQHFGAPLFERRGKRLVLTPFGTEAASYAADIFRLGRELTDVARGRAAPGRERIRVGIVAGMPKTLAHHMLAPALDRLGNGVALVRQDSPQVLVEALVAGRLHVVLTDHIPATPGGSRIHAHLLGQTDILLYARAKLARRARVGFPGSLSGVPFVLPASEAPLRKRLEAWFTQHDVQVSVTAEVEDAGLLRVFGSAGRGVFPVRAALRTEVEDLHDVALVGHCEGLHERYYAVTTERRIGNPVLRAMVERARKDLEPGLQLGAKRTRGAD
jgi:LysR family transcriptional activator of nhaA